MSLASYFFIFLFPSTVKWEHAERAKYPSSLLNVVLFQLSGLKSVVWMAFLFSFSGRSDQDVLFNTILVEMGSQQRSFSLAEFKSSKAERCPGLRIQPLFTNKPFLVM